MKQVIMAWFNVMIIESQNEYTISNFDVIIIQQTVKMRLGAAVAVIINDVPTNLKRNKSTPTLLYLFNYVL